MRPLSDYKIEHGYKDPETGASYDDIGEILQSKVLGHCGCGNPEKNLKLIYDMIAMHTAFRQELEKYFRDNILKTQIFRDYKGKLQQYVNDNWEKFSDFFWYVMDDKGIMTHGTSIPGWVEDKNFMEALEIWHEEYEKDEDEE